MTSPYRVLEVARDILQKREFLRFEDDRFEGKCIARTVNGYRTDPANEMAVMFTLTGAVARAAVELSGSWTDGHGGEVFDIAIHKLQERTSFQFTRFNRVCDKLGKEGCIKLIEEIIP